MKIHIAPSESVAEELSKKSFNTGLSEYSKNKYKDR
jgi:hypothetical protein